MPGKRITELTALSGANSANDDDIIIFDATANETKRISRSQLALGITPDLPLQYFLGVLNTAPTQRLDGQALQLGDYYLDAVTKYTTIYNGSGWNSYSSVIDAQQAAENARDAAVLAQTAAEAAQLNAETAEDNAKISEVNAGTAEVNATLAQTAAETARDAAFINANIYADTAAGLAAVALGEQFQVVGNDEVIRYREDAGPVATELVRYPVASVIQAPNKFARSIFFNPAIPEYSSRTSGVAQNENQFTINTVYATTIYNAVGRLAVGKRCSLAVRPISGGILVAGTYIRFKSGVSTLATRNVSSTTDEMGYYKVENLTVPATCTTIEVQVDNVTSGDVLEILFCPSTYTHATRSTGTSRPAYGIEYVDSAPHAVNAIGGALEVTPRPNGTADVWQALLAARGSTAGATTISALRRVSEDLRISGLLDKLVYLNLRCGDDATAALTPFVAIAGPSLDSTTATISWTEANGLSNTTVSLGINAARVGLGRHGVSLGAYLLANSADSSPYMISAGGLFGLTPLFAGYHIFDSFNGGGSGRVLAGPGITSTLGTLIGARDSSGASRISRNGRVLASTANQGGEVPDAGFSVATTSTRISGGDFIGFAMDDNDMANMHIILHTFNLAIGRGVVTEGVF